MKKYNYTYGGNRNMISYDDLLEIYDKCMTVYENDLMEHCVSGDDLVTDFQLDGEYKILKELKRLILEVKNADKKEE